MLLPEWTRTALPAAPYALWARGELDDFLELPEKNHAEVVGGEITVSVAPWDMRHGPMVGEINRAFTLAELADPA
ncbi:hypothetical protein GCM10009678_15840 [Actinomadura kijaniata]|uniref:Uma2 family endonuclease n=1 Tax=Actinomadura namibiensis TaxID=182080 RepID=A0A7W3LJ05_ACTNM|nr:hypothetical protein [Actinomadura namibiensis]MBA8948938.1 hypothetical protein [Actinomadura namibiensis]